MITAETFRALAEQPKPFTYIAQMVFAGDALLLYAEHGGFEVPEALIRVFPAENTKFHIARERGSVTVSSSQLRVDAAVFDTAKDFSQGRFGTRIIGITLAHPVFYVNEHIRLTLQEKLHDSGGIRGVGVRLMIESDHPIGRRMVEERTAAQELAYSEHLNGLPRHSQI